VSLLTEPRVRRETVMLPTEARTDGVQLAATVVADPSWQGPRIVCLAFPGGGYGRAYFDIHHPELAGPSQAEFHARRGVVFLTCDPYGGGESTCLPQNARDLAATIDGVDAAVRRALQTLADGTLVDWLDPIEISLRVAIGHSLGGMQLTAHQAAHPTFDAVGFLGWSAIHTQVPTQDGAVSPHADPEKSGPTSLEEAWSGPITEALAPLRYIYYWEDVSPRIVAEDLSVGFPTRTAAVLPAWTTRTFLPFAAICMGEGIVADEAAAIQVPVFVGAGERDVTLDLHAEASAYHGSRDVTLFELSRSAHMHNFSPRRTILWERLQLWLDTIESLVRRERDDE
jgi:pimeloyl-ACP methyl ester carboxylesterase